MTHTVHPYAHRLGILRDWKSRWFSADPKRYREFIKCDTEIRQFLDKKLRGFYVSSVEIERGEKKLRIIIKTSRPGLIIGRSGDGAVKLKKEIDKVIGKLNLSDKQDIKLDIEEVKNPEYFYKFI